MDRKGKAIRQNIEMAYGVYCLLGGNVAKTQKELEKRGLKLSRPSLDKWIKDYRFEERMKQADAERQEAEDCQLSLEQKMMKKLLRQIERYEEYLDSLPINQMDHQATYALTNLYKTVVELSRKAKGVDAKSPATLRKKADEIMRAEYGIER
ncbi:MAG: hypothetical protein M0Z52_03860 [Actinomycetota bacterium]|nr:hypothetical protein [Actinomycetota bacterium]